MIAGEYKGGFVPENMKLYEFAESDWAVFKTKGPLPDSLQKLNTKVWQEWYPNEGQNYLPNTSANIEYYSQGNQMSEKYECGIMIPINKNI